MNDLAFTALDILVVIVLLVSTVLALARGGMREILGLASWVGAAVVGLATFKIIQPKILEAVQGTPYPDIIADATTFLIVFIVPLIIFKVISGMIARGIAGSRVGFLDRILGLIFGLARGALILVAGYYLYTVGFAPVEDQPSFVTSALSHPYLLQGSEWLDQNVPSDWIERSKASIDSLIDGGAAEADGADAATDTNSSTENTDGQSTTDGNTTGN